MNPKFENILRDGMTKFGHLLEAVIGRAKKAKVSVKHDHGVLPIIALEGQVPMGKLKELIDMSIERIVKPLIPNLIDKSGLELADGEARFGLPMKEKGAAIAVHVDIGGTGGTYPKESDEVGVHNLKAEIGNVPFENDFYDFVIANLATPKQGDVVKAIKEVGRLASLGATCVIVDYHPFGRFAKRGSVRLRSMESIVKGVEDYFKICKVSGLSINYVKEAFFDEMLRAFFMTPEEKSVFRSIKDTPFLIFLVASKKGR